MMRADRLHEIFIDSPMVLELLMAVVRHRRMVDYQTDLIGPSLYLPLGCDDLVLAQQIATMLNPIGRSVAELLGSRKVVVVEVHAPEEAYSTKETIVQALDAHFALLDSELEYDGLPPDKRSLPAVSVIERSGVRGLLREVFSASYRTQAFVVAILTPDSDERYLQTIQQTADHLVTMPELTPEFIERAFHCIYGEGSDEIAALSGIAKLDAVQIAAIMRPGLSAVECLAALRRVLGEPPKVAQSRFMPGLEEAAGYGEARNWALELAADYSLWRAGTLEWDEVPERGLLLSGAPGTGKTTFARLLANTLNSPLIETSVASWNGFDNLSGTIGEMNRVFDKAKALKGVLFIDELDGINRRDRSTDRNRSYWDQVVNHLLTRVNDILECPGVVVVGATNYPDNIDPALLRSGRIERHIRIEHPGLDDRRGILDRYLKGALAHDDLDRIAALTERFTGADLKSLARSALTRARRAKRKLEAADILGELCRDMEALGEQDRRRALIYAAGQEMVSQTLGIEKGRGPEYQTLPMLQDRLAAFMAGRVAEEMLLGQISTLGETDLINATQLAEAIEMRFGMGAIGPMARQYDQKDEAQRSAVLQQIEKAIDRARTVLDGRIHDFENAGLRSWGKGPRRGVLH